MKVRTLFAHTRARIQTRTAFSVSGRYLMSFDLGENHSTTSFEFRKIGRSGIWLIALVLLPAQNGQLSNPASHFFSSTQQFFTDSLLCLEN